MQLSEELRPVVWGYGKSWIVRYFDAGGKLVRCSRWYSSKVDAELNQ